MGPVLDRGVGPKNRQFLVATQRLYKRVCSSVRGIIRPSVTSYFLGLLGAPNAVYTALFGKFVNR